MGLYDYLFGGEIDEEVTGSFGKLYGSFFILYDDIFYYFCTVSTFRLSTYKTA